MAVDLNDWRVQRYIEWLCAVPAARVPERESDLAATLGMDDTALAAWRGDHDFLGAWDVYYRRTIASPERLQAVMEALVETASDRTDPRMVPAAKLYLESVGKAKPPAVVQEPKDVRKMSDDELFAILATRAEQSLSPQDG